jgi:surface polysaccharide O-acyltransferase-like enzyme
MWFVYAIIGLYLLTPFLKRAADTLTDKELLSAFFVVILATTIAPFINVLTPIYIYLFDPPMNGYYSYFILGYILGKRELSKRLRICVYTGGILGFVIGCWGNVSWSSGESINLIFNMGYALPNYLTAAAIFVFFKRNTEKLIKGMTAKIALRLSSVSFGVYWIHVAILEILTGLLLPSLSPAGVIAINFVITTAISTMATLLMSKIPIVNRLLM